MNTIPQKFLACGKDRENTEVYYSIAFFKKINLSVRSVQSVKFLIVFIRNYGQGKL